MSDAAGVPLQTSADVNAWAVPRLAALEHEELWALALDGRNRLRAARRIAMGGLHGLSTQARDALRAMLREAASAFILVHNHPSGDPTPSAADVEMTKQVVSALSQVGIAVHDHIIVGKNRHTSFRTSRLI